MIFSDFYSARGLSSSKTMSEREQKIISGGEFFLHFLLTNSSQILGTHSGKCLINISRTYFPLSHDERVLESLLQIFNTLHVKSGLGFPAGTSHINPMTLLPFPGWMGWKTHRCSEFVTGAVNVAEP